MSEEELKDCFAKVKANSNQQEKLKSAKSAERVRTIAIEHCFSALAKIRNYG
jgi:hypothetical protein